MTKHTAWFEPCCVACALDACLLLYAEALREHCGGGAPWKARAIWDMLHARRSRPEYQAAPLAGRPVVVCGAGPCGLRAALEMALLGASVTVIEKRGLADACGRINRVHLWEWCKQDLVQWGAKLFDPPGGAFGRDNDFCHIPRMPLPRPSDIGIGELQLLLLKNALLLGVDVRFGAEALAVEQGELACACGARLPCWSLVLSSGASSPISHAVGLNPVVVGLRGKGSAIGVVANFANSQEADQMALRQFSWARQFNAPLFRRITEEVSVDLENVVYYKGARHHYMVMTPTKASLIGAGVLRDGQPAGGELLCGGNVDAGRLRELTSSVAAFFGLPADALLEGPQGATIFDFSGVRLESPTAMASGVLVCAVGDALLEPFWPEGLGILRGFMSALDAASALALGAQDGHSAAVAQLAATFTVLKSVAAQTAAQCLQKDMTPASTGWRRPRGTRPASCETRGPAAGRTRGARLRLRAPRCCPASAQSAARCNGLRAGDRRPPRGCVIQLLSPRLEWALAQQ
ncbi:unnamed protein product, partial [Prorocentrum cordatum]